MMDYPTLVICTLMIAFFMAVTTAVLYFTNKDDKYLIEWTFAGIGFSVSNLFGFLSFSESFNFAFLPMLANTGFMLGHLLIYGGLCRLLEKPLASIHYLSFVFIIFALHQIDWLMASVANRIMVFYPIVILINITIVRTLIPSRHSTLGQAYWPLIMVNALFALQQFVRGSGMLSGHEFFSSEFMLNLGTLAVMLFLFVTTLGFVNVVNWRKEIELRRLSETDSLTGWMNRYAMEKKLNQEVARAARKKEPYAFILLDIDRFKNINDSYGHTVGDAVIQQVCDTATQASRGYDHRYRLGGEEFCLFIQGETETDVKMIAERIRRTVETQQIILGQHNINVTISLGVAIEEAPDKKRGQEWKRILDLADQALYRSKNAGRNQTTVIEHGVPSYVAA